ncbi:MAG TPA: hypothetical protein DHV62_10890 [Elusimicrobia bacterium]|jgi:hypothetical protein|nr:hypothetical protein [Elusimicrobiota bacterium]
MKKNWLLILGIIIGGVNVCFGTVGKPQPIDPANGIAINTGNPTFIWSGVSGATTYYLQVSTDVNFSNITSTGVSNNLYISTVTLAPTTFFATITSLNQNIFYWRVSTDSGTADSFSGWSSTFSVKIDMNPPDSVLTFSAMALWRAVKLYWRAPESIDNGQYWIMYSTSSEPIVDWNSTTDIKWSTSTVLNQDESKTISYLTNNVNYWFGIKIADQAGNWSGRVSLSTTPFNSPPDRFQLSTPTGNVIVENYQPTFTWVTATDPDQIYGDAISSYTLVYSSNNFAVSQSSAGLVAGSYAVTPALIDDTTYWWYVKVFDLEGDLRQSATAIFRVDKENSPPSSFDLLTPTGSVIARTRTPKLEWSGTTDSDPWDRIEYEVRWSSTNFVTYESSTGLKVNYLTVPVNRSLVENATYWWRVYALDYWDYPVPGVYKKRGSEVISTLTGTFRVDSANEPPRPFSLVSPVDNKFQAGVNTVVLSGDTTTFFWEAKGDPDPDDDVASYELDLSWRTGETVPYGKISSTQVFTSNNYYTFPVSLLAEDTSYNWKVIAHDQAGLSRSTGPWTFWINRVNSPPGAFDLTEPTNTWIMNTYQPTFKWSKSSDIEETHKLGDKVSYTLWLSSTNFMTSYSSFPAISGLSSPALPNLQENTPYYWYVEAYDNSRLPSGSGKRESNSKRTFSINVSNELPLVFNLVSPSSGALVNNKTPTFDWEDAIDPDPGDSIKYKLRYSRIDPTLTKSTEVANLSVSNYTVTTGSPLTEDATYYWRVVALDKAAMEGKPDGCIRESPIWHFFIPLLTRPKAPTGFKGTIISEPPRTFFDLSWELVSQNEDGTPYTDQKGYRIYRSTDMETVGQTLSYREVSHYVDNSYRDEIGDKIYFYLMRAIDSSGIESADSIIIDSSEKENIVFFSTGTTTVTLIIPKEASSVLYSTGNTSGKDLKIEILETSAENIKGVIYELKSYRIDDESKQPVSIVFPATVEVKFSYTWPFSGAPAISFSKKDLGVFWHNGVEYVYVPSDVDSNNQIINVKTKNIGRYVIQQVLSASEFKIQRSQQRIITPNNDGAYDTIEFTYDNPANITVWGEVYDIGGSKVAEMKVDLVEKKVSWDGKDEDGNVCREGVYIYQIKSGDGKVYNGTVVLAK